MPGISQRTLAKVIVALSEMLPHEADTFPLMRDFWRTKLFEWGFPDWLTDHFISRGTNWSVVIPDLTKANVKTKGGAPVASVLCNSMLLRLTVAAYEDSKSGSAKENLRRSLQLDGYEVGAGKIGSIEGPVSVEEEKSRLLRDLKASRLARQDVISQHIADAESLFSDGRHHPAIGEGRSALQAVIEDTVTLLEGRTGRPSGGGVKNQIEFMAQNEFLSSDEQSAFLSAWGFLCSGNHPGLSSDDEGRIGVVLCLEFIQILLAKGKVLLK
jgi:hypothetical protein